MHKTNFTPLKIMIMKVRYSIWLTEQIIDNSDDLLEQLLMIDILRELKANLREYKNEMLEQK